MHYTQHPPLLVPQIVASSVNPIYSNSSNLSSLLWFRQNWWSMLSSLLAYSQTKEMWFSPSWIWSRLLLELEPDWSTMVARISQWTSVLTGYSVDLRYHNYICLRMLVRKYNLCCAVGIKLHVVDLTVLKLWLLSVLHVTSILFFHQLCSHLQPEREREREREECVFTLCCSHS